MGCQGSKLGWPRARQVSYPLYLPLRHILAFKNHPPSLLPAPSRPPLNQMDREPLAFSFWTGLHPGAGLASRQTRIFLIYNTEDMQGTSTSLVLQVILETSSGVGQMPNISGAFWSDPPPFVSLSPWEVHWSAVLPWIPCLVQVPGAFPSSTPLEVWP